MNTEDFQLILFTLEMASLSTLLILPFGVALAWLLARTQWPGKSMVETMVALPLVMPPVATGLILLVLLGRHGALGRSFASIFGSDIIFTWRAVVVAMAVMSFPFLVRTAQTAFEGVDPRLESVARTLGANRLRVLLTITLPLAARGLGAGVIWAFARAIGEFGATILVAGNIPARTTTIAIAIYSDIQIGDEAHAYRLLVVSAAIAFLAVAAGNRFLTVGGRK